jgi:hypothetical protein
MFSNDIPTFGFKSTFKDVMFDQVSQMKEPDKCIKQINRISNSGKPCIVVYTYTLKNKNCTYHYLLNHSTYPRHKF